MSVKYEEGFAIGLAVPLYGETSGASFWTKLGPYQSLKMVWIVLAIGLNMFP